MREVLLMGQEGVHGAGWEPRCQVILYSAFPDRNHNSWRPPRVSRPCSHHVRKDGHRSTHSRKVALRSLLPRHCCWPRA